MRENTYCFRLYFVVRSDIVNTSAEAVRMVRNAESHSDRRKKNKQTKTTKIGNIQYWILNDDAA